jgi:hypothetical protein
MTTEFKSPIHPMPCTVEGITATSNQKVTVKEGTRILVEQKTDTHTLLRICDGREGEEVWIENLPPKPAPRTIDEDFEDIVDEIAAVIMENIEPPKVRIGDHWVAGVKEIVANHVRKTFGVHIHFEYPPDRNAGLGVAIYSSKGKHVVPIQVGELLYEGVVMEYVDKSTIGMKWPGWYFEIQIPNPNAKEIKPEDIGLPPGTEL